MRAEMIKDQQLEQANMTGTGKQANMAESEKRDRTGQKQQEKTRKQQEEANRN